jgi:hypothetical protein
VIGGTPSIDGETPGIPKDVSTSILQFTKSQTGVGSFKPDDPSLYFGKVILPWPAGIIPLRLDTFPPVDSGDSQHPKHVAPELINCCGLSQTAVAICLQYGYNFSGPVLPPTTPTMNLHLHMRCCNDSGSTVDHINAALTDAAAIFTVPNFDVQLKKVAVVASGFDDQPPVLGVSPEDERAAIEDGACRVAKTPVGSLIKKLPQHSKVPQKTTNTRAQAKSTEGGGIVSQENVSPANCPHFFVG